MTRAYCLTCNDQVDVIDGRCARGHEVSTDDLGPQPWIGRALSAVGERPSQHEEPESTMPDELPAEPPHADPQPADDSDELAALLADLDDGGPADLPSEDDAAMTYEPAADLSAADAEDTSNELAALAEELALRADPEPEEVAEPDDDTLGALDDAMTAWDESDEQIVAPSEPVPDEPEPAIPPPPPPGTPAMASPPPPPPAPEDLFEAAPVTADEVVDQAEAMRDDEAPAAAADDGVEDAVAQDAPAPMPEPDEPPAQIDLTNFTASGKRIDTTSTPRKRGLFGR